MAVDIGNDPPQSTSVTLGSGQVAQADLTDAATNTASPLRKTTHQSSVANGPTAGFGSKWLDQLANGINAMVDAAQWISKWKTATSGAEDAAIDIQATRGGTLATMATFNGKNATGNFPFELATNNADGATQGYTAAGSQEVHKSGAGDLIWRMAVAGAGRMMAIYFPSWPALRCVSGATYPDVIIGANTDPGAATTDGFVFIPAVSTTGAQTGVPSNTSKSTHMAMMANRTDSKIWGYNAAAAWVSQTLIQTPTSILAALTNNCTPSGTTGTIPNWTNLSTYGTDAQAIHDAVSQLAKKVTIMETALRQNTSMAIT